MESTDVIVVGLILALVEVAKTTGMPARFAPLFATLMGVAFALYQDIGFLQGLIYGTSAVGLYSGVRATAGR